VEDLLIAVAIGFVGGGLGAMLGIGGGAIFVPGLVILLGTEQATAQGVSLIAIVATAIVATAQHARKGNVHFPTAAWIIPTAIVFGAGGAAVATQLSPGALRIVFGVLLLALSTRLMYTSLPRRRQA
jgi:uncharacterized membrane protein YfcA